MNKVLALKYTPKKFDDLIGQDTISSTLSLALDSKRLSHAYLFSGLRGSGKTSTARIMAKALVCDNGPTSTPCEKCANCISANESRHLDIIEMDAASNRGIDDIKDLIEHTKYQPSSAKYKVFIIDEVHMLTPQAFNALLKTLEEPPDFVKFILATTDPLKLPATILSRTQHFRFKKIAPTDVKHHLSHILNLEDIPFEPDALDILARSGQGSLRDTLTLLDQAIIFSKGKITTNSVTDMMGMIDPSFMEELFDNILAHNDMRKFIDQLEAYEVGQVIDEMTIFLKYKMLSNSSKYTTYLYDRFFRILADAKQLLALNSDSGFVMILTISKMIEATNIKTIDEVINEVQNTQPTITEQTKPTATTTVETQNTQQEKLEVQQASEETPAIITNEDRFKDTIAKVYERSYDLGVCFEKSFSFNNFENNTLVINSIAQGECKKILYKNFALLREFIEDIFGQGIDIEFNKLPIPQEDISKQPAQNETVSSMIESVEFEDPNQNIQGANSCVGVMCDSDTPTNLAQQEISMDEILNSKFVNTVREVFKSETLPEIQNKV